MEIENISYKRLKILLIIGLIILIVGIIMSERICIRNRYWIYFNGYYFINL
jgi:hypothetical protein